MNRFLIISLLIILTANMHILAQRKVPLNLPKYDKKPLHFGFTLGLNTMDFTVRNSGSFLSMDTVYSIENIPRVGFNIGIVSNLRLHEYFDLRFLPGLNFGQRDLVYLLLEDNMFREHVMKIESIFLDFPLVFKYKAERLNNFRPYLVGGGSIRYDMASQKKVKEAEKPKIRLVPFDAYYEVGFGIDYYLQYFKFSYELKFAVGVFNVVNYDQTTYTQAIQRLNSKMIILSFHFE